VPPVECACVAGQQAAHGAAERRLPGSEEQTRTGRHGRGLSRPTTPGPRAAWAASAEARNLNNLATSPTPGRPYARAGPKATLRRPAEPHYLNSLATSPPAVRVPSPNPASPSTAVSFDVPTPGAAVSIRVYDVNGRLVRSLVDGQRAAGYHSAAWDLRNEEGRPVASGVYFCRMEAGAFRDTKKVVLLQ
jgi:hypothetical protein